LPGTLKPQGYIKPCTAGKEHAANAAEFDDFIYASEIFFVSFLTHEASMVMTQMGPYYCWMARHVVY
jgi:hypothetical protein